MNVLCYLPTANVMLLNDLNAVAKTLGMSLSNYASSKDLLLACKDDVPLRRRLLITCESELELIDEFTKRHSESLCLIGINNSLATAVTRLRKALHTHNFVVFSLNGIDRADLLTALRKYSSGDLFGVDKYLRHGTNISSFVINNTKSKDACINNLLDSIGGLGPVGAFSCYSESARRIAEAVDEIILTMIASEDQIYLQDKSGNGFQLNHNTTIRVDWGFDGELLAFAVRDTFGRLEKDELLRCLEGDTELGQPLDAFIRKLGFKRAVERVERLIVGVRPDRHTEVVGTLHFERRQRTVKTNMHCVQFQRL